MTPEIFDLLKVFIPAIFTGVSGLVVGIVKQKSANRDSEFTRLSRVIDEIQEENRELRKELRQIRADHALERATDKAEIQMLKAEVAVLRQENADLRVKLNINIITPGENQ